MAGLEVGFGVAGVVGVAMAFKGAVDTALWIETFLDDEKAGCGHLALRYHIEKTRLQLWGELCKANDDSESSRCTLRDKPLFIQETVVRILGEIRSLNEEADALVDKHKLDLPKIPDLDIHDNLYQNAAIPRALSRLSVKPRARFSWTLKKKLEFEKVVSKLRELIRDLRELTLSYDEPQLLANVLPLHVLASVHSSELLEILSDPGNNFDRALTLSARAKSLQQDHSLEPAGFPSSITNQRLKFLAGSSTLGVLTRPDGSMLTVWIEWNIVDPGPALWRYIDRINSLGCLLERVSEPALCLPPFYGVYDDLAYETEHGAKRIGYVFGHPQDHTPHPYDGNLRDHPPRTLSMLIRDQNHTPIPLLGDRFHLAYTLAAAFGRFHAAGWLHKGLYSGSIVFLQRAEGRGITVTEPFITGFQYSRPQHETSLSRGPLENKKLEHYYHPDADQGFSKQRDLYGLGVVLCEIGRWGLVADSVSDRTRKSLVSRTSWQKYMVEKVAQDLGWRMGGKYQSVVMTLLQCRLPSDDDDTLFVQQYLEKIVQPLSKCKA